MDNNLYVLVAGTGETSRANVEALLEDTLYTNKNNVVFVLIYNKNATQGHKFVAQLAKDKDKDIIVFANSDASTEGIPSATFNPTEEPVKDALKFVKGKKANAFLLWNDEDERMFVTVQECTKAKVPAYDLTEGLIPLDKINYEPAPVPNMPEVETRVKPEPKDEIDELEEDEEDFEDDEDEDLNDELYFGVQALVKAIARAVVEELKNDPESPLRKPQKAPRK